MARKQRSDCSNLLKFLLLLPILDIPPRLPGETGNIYQTLIKRRRRQRDDCASEVPLQSGLSLVPREQPDEASSESENDFGVQQKNNSDEE